MQPNATTKLDLENHPTRLEAQAAYLKGVDALSRDPEVRPGHVHWLRQQKPVAMNDEGWILVGYPTETEERLAHSNEAMVRLGHRLRNIEAAKGVLTVAVGDANGPGESNDREARKRRPRRDEREPWERRPVYMPGFLIATTLPHSDPKASEFERVNGKVTTTLVSTKSTGLPFGVYPRLIVIHLATEAVRTQRRSLRLGRSANELLGRMGISNSGGSRGQAARARDQLDRLCATQFVTTHLSHYGGWKVDVADRWLEKTEDGLMVGLSERFFEQVTRSAVPLDPLILRQLRPSSLSIDIYGWLTYRMPTVERPTAIPWASVERQFGSEYRHPRQFRWRFRRCLDRVRECWPGGPGVEVQEKRVVLMPGPPSVLGRMERSNAKRG